MKHAIVLIAAVLVPCVSSAQVPLVKGLTPAGMPTVFVTDDRGVETRGGLIRFDLESVIVLVGADQRRFETDRIVRIEKSGDSLKNGALIGAAVGVLNGVLAMGMADCPGRGSRCAGARVAGLTLSTAFYAAVGVGVDALVQGRTVIYKRPAVHVAASSQGAAVTLRLSW